MSKERDELAREIHDKEFGLTRDDPMTWPPRIYAAADAILSTLNEPTKEPTK